MQKQQHWFLMAICKKRYTIKEAAGSRLSLWIEYKQNYIHLFWTMIIYTYKFGEDK